MKYFLTLFIVAFFINSLNAQTTADYAVQVSAKVQKSPPQIILQWPASSLSQGYTIFRKGQGSRSWGKRVATLSGGATSFIDDSVKIGQSYEYQVASFAGSYSVYGYILAGIEVSPAEYRGKVILIVDDSIASGLSFEINRLISDIQGDGWVVLRHNVSRSETVPNVKAIIEADYNDDKTNTTTLFLLGHVPVPYSGDYYPDGHTIHAGAWPADSYYGDMLDNFTDSAVNDKTGAYSRNWNVPGDGKFDNDLINSLSLGIGRVDLNDMPAFGVSELELLRRYLNKDHAFRVKQIVARERGLIDDKFGAFGGEAFAASGYKAFAPMFGADNIVLGNYLDSNAKGSYLWSYACSGGDPQGFIGYFHTDTLVTDSLPTVFNMFFGSWFGDWGFEDNFLRAPLASKGWQLTNCWSGRPQWIMHQMALGENIGYCARLSASDNTTYFRTSLGQSFGALRNIALMGDPTLRMHIVGPPARLILSNTSDSAANTSRVSLHWLPSTDIIIGYNIYRSSGFDKAFVKVNTNSVTDTVFTDSFPPHGTNYYMVRALKLQQSGSGTYYNMSEGILSNATYSFSGMESAKLSAISFSIYPNPSKDIFYIELEDNKSPLTKVSVTDVFGRDVIDQMIVPGIQKVSISLASQPSGIYFVTLRNERGISAQKIVRR